MAIDFFEIAHAELCANNIALCDGCGNGASHARGCAVKSSRTIHLKSGLRTRSSLHRLLHEVGHIVNDETGMKRWEQEAAAEKYATDSMRALGISVPRKVTRKGSAYVNRMYRWGRNIAKGRRAAAGIA